MAKPPSTDSRFQSSFKATFSSSRLSDTEPIHPGSRSTGTQPAFILRRGGKHPGPAFTSHHDWNYVLMAFVETEVPIVRAPQLLRELAAMANVVTVQVLPITSIRAARASSYLW